jgi:2-desacetyl-2-hydroxyethyl bacteriochlorophyllide A dehydrogenase
MADEACAIFFVAPRRVEVRPVPIHAPGPGEVLVRAICSGISSGSELLAYRGELEDDLVIDESISSLAGGSFRYPFRYGYSCAGYVEAVGSDVETPVGPVFAFHPHQERFCLPAAEVVPIGDVPFRQAVLFPLVETALQASLDVGPVADRTVLVTGLGAVGLLVGALLARQGARVLGSEPRSVRRAVAVRFGVEAASPDRIAVLVAEATDGTGIPLLVEASGRPEALASALELLAHEGVALVLSWYGNKPATLPLGGAFHRRRLTIRSSQVSTIPADLQSEWTVPRRREAARELMTALPLDLLATHEFRFADAADAFAAVDGGLEDLLHAALCYG